MSVKKYCYCDCNNKFETLDKEEILAAIAQAVETGKIGECDTGFITTIKTINGQPLKFFVGDQAEYGALDESQRANLFAIITNDTTREGLLTSIEELQTKCADLDKKLSSGELMHYSYMGARTDRNGRMLHGTAENPLNIDEYKGLTYCGSYSMLWNDIKSGCFTGLPSFEIEGGYAANLDVICDYNESGANTSFQHLRIRATHKDNNAYLLMFTRCYDGTSWSGWMRFVSAEEMERGTVKAAAAGYADRAKNANYAIEAYSAERAATAQKADFARSDTYGDLIDKNYMHLGTKSEENFMLLRGYEHHPLDLDNLKDSGSFSLYWTDISNGYVKHLPSFEISGGYAANLYISNDYNGNTTAFQTLEVRANMTVGERTMLVFRRYCDGSKWSDWLRFASAEEIESGKIPIGMSLNARDAERAVYATSAGWANTDANGAAIDTNYMFLGIKNGTNKRLLSGTATTPLNLDDITTGGSYSLLWTDVRDGYIKGLPSFEIEGGYAANLLVSNDYYVAGKYNTAHQFLELRAPISYGNSNMLVFHRFCTGEAWSNWLRFISAEEVENKLEATEKEVENKLEAVETDYNDKLYKAETERKNNYFHQAARYKLAFTLAADKYSISGKITGKNSKLGGEYYLAIVEADDPSQTVGTTYYTMGIIYFDGLNSIIEAPVAGQYYFRLSIKGTRTINDSFTEGEVILTYHDKDGNLQTLANKSLILDRLTDDIGYNKQ